MVDDLGRRHRGRDRGLNGSDVGIVGDLHGDAVDAVDAEQFTGLGGVHLHQNGAQRRVVGAERGGSRQREVDATVRNHDLVRVTDDEAVLGGGIEVHRELADLRRGTVDHGEGAQLFVVDPVERQLRWAVRGDGARRWP